MPTENFGEVLRSAIELLPRSINEAEIARRAGIDPSTLSVLKAIPPRIKNPSSDLRLKLAIALANDRPGEMYKIAERFWKAGDVGVPSPQDDWTADERDDWTRRLSRLWVERLQAHYHEIDLGLSTFYEITPFLMARHEGYLEQLDLDVRLPELGWNMVPNFIGGDSSLSDRERDARPRTLRLAFLNRSTVAEQGMAFCFPLNVFEPAQYQLITRHGSARVKPIEAIDSFLDAHTKHGRNAEILVSGRDTEVAARTMFSRAVGENDERLAQVRYITLQQFATVDAFQQGLGDAHLGGLAQSDYLLSHKCHCVASGLDFGLAPEMNGLVCSKDLIWDQDVKRAIIQILAAWYRAISRLDQPDGCAQGAKLFADRANSLSAKSAYAGQAFTHYWDGPGKRLIPRSPLEAQALYERYCWAHLDDDYFQIMWDEIAPLNDWLRVPHAVPVTS